MNKELKISALKEGTVIDHIPARQVFRVLRILNPNETENMLTVGTNLPSSRIGKKGIIKIANRILTETDVNKIALLAPSAKVNIIQNYEVVKKIDIEVPDKFLGIVKCSNPNCITNNEFVVTDFEVKSRKPLKLQCHHCERLLKEEDISIQR